MRDLGLFVCGCEIELNVKNGENGYRIESGITELERQVIERRLLSTEVETTLGSGS
jgi:hypothetical protein